MVMVRVVVKSEGSSRIISRRWRCPNPLCMRAKNTWTRGSREGR